MAARKDPASLVVEFFETSSLDTAQTVLAICKGVVARRQPARAKRATSKPAAGTDAISQKASEGSGSGRS